MSETERDPRLDAAWRLASREEPPAGLDAAIRAAARRAVHGAPGRGRHGWYPLAAAATVALLAIGIAQLTPPERVTPTIIADAAAPGEARQEGARQAAPDTGPVAAKPAVPPAVAPPPQKKLETSRAADAVVGASTNARAPVAAMKVPQPTLGSGHATPSAPPEPTDNVSAESAAQNAAPAPAAATPSRSEAFPAAPQAESRREVALEERTPAAHAATAAAVASAPTQGRVAAAQVTRADDAKAKEGSPPGVDDWIKQIRALIHAGRRDEAAKELEAFRSLYGERADALLPPDLRQSKR